MTTTPPEPPPFDDDRPPVPPSAPGGSSAPPPPPGGGVAPPAAPGYSTPPPAGYGAQPPSAGYGAQPPGYPAGEAAPPAGAYALWPKRALSGLIDFVGPGLLAFLIGRGSSGLGFVLSLAALAWALYNAYLGGQTGQSYGKKIAGIRLISEATGQPPGGGLGIGRYVVHILDAIPCYLGFLWPLWDSKRQTFADKILKTVVVTA